MLYRFVDSCQAGPGPGQKLSTILYNIHHGPAWQVSTNLNDIYHGPVQQLSTNLYDIYHCWVYSK